MDCGVLFKGTSISDFRGELVTQLTCKNILKEADSTTRIRIAKHIASRLRDGDRFRKVDNISIKRRGVVSRSR